MPFKIKPSKKPKEVRALIEGFPGFGLVSTITTGYLIDCLECEKIGTYYFEEPPATVAIHEGKVLESIGIYLMQKPKIVILHSLTSAFGIEWKAAQFVTNLCNYLNAEELISIEGISSSEIGPEPKAYYYTKNPILAKNYEKIGIKKINEGIIVGVTAALLQTHPAHLSCIFAEAQPGIPDNRAAAKIIEVLDKYLGLKIDYVPLLKKAEEIELSFKKLIEQILKIKRAKPKAPPYIV